MIRRPPRSTLDRSSAASDVYKRQVQDAFVKVFTHITSYREDLPFEVWFTRILVNGCLDLRKARARRLRWALPMSSQTEAPPPEPRAPRTTPEARLSSAQRTQTL